MDLLVHEELEVVVLLLLKVLGQLLDLHLQFFVLFLEYLILFVVEVSFLGKFLLSLELPCEGRSERVSYQVPDVLYVIDEHSVG